MNKLLDVPMEPTEEGLVSLLNDLYWKSARSEISNMVLFFNTVAHDKFSTESDRLPQSNNFKNIFDAWTGGQSGFSRGFDTDTLYRDCLQQAKEHYEVDSGLRIARSLLQSSAFLDIDICYEPNPVLPALNLKKLKKSYNVEIVQLTDTSGNVNDYLHTVICSQCISPSRFPIYYECQIGCNMSVSNPMPLAVRNSKGKFIAHKKQHFVAFSTPFRICRRCCLDEAILPGNCNLKHLRTVIHKNPVGKEIGKIPRTAVDRTSSKDTGKQPSKKWLPVELFSERIEAFSPLAGDFLKFARDAVAPAGSFHVVTMFGPLTVESGVPNSKQGIVVSTRPFPSLFQTTNIANTLIRPNHETESTDEAWNRLIVYEDRVSKKRKVVKSHTEVHERLPVCCMKQVYGGAFSGYPENSVDRENLVLTTFLAEAKKCEFKPSKTVVSRRKQVERSSKRIIDTLKALLESEVTKYLSRVAKLMLNPATKLSWNMITNNCQRLTERLIRGKEFEYFFPRLPKDFGSPDASTISEKFTWPRYLISFGDRIENSTVSITQTNSIITEFLNSNHTDEEDLIDRIEIKLHELPEEFTSSLHENLGELALSASSPDDPNDPALYDSLWTLPRDTLSVIQYHILRRPQKYSTTTGFSLSNDQWIQNRARMLRQLSIFASLAGSLGTTLLSRLSADQDLIKQVTIPKSRIYGTLRSDEKVRVLRTGGIVFYHVSRDTVSAETAELVAFLTRNWLFHPTTRKSVNRLLNGMKVVQRSWVMVSPLDQYFVFYRILLDIMSVRMRDDWVYVNYPGLGVFAHQVLRKSKNTRNQETGLGNQSPHREE